jgi:DNA repair exonuclease SbcCD ATPase subunit
MIILPTILLTESKNENKQQQQQMVQQQQQMVQQQHKIEQQQQQISEQQKEQQQIKEQQRKVEKEQKVKQQQQQEALKQLEQDLALIYQRAKDSLVACPYDEFSWVCIIEMGSDLIAYQEGIKDRANSPELEAVLLARFDLILAKYLNDICDLNEQLQLPSYRDIEPKDTWPFYDSLKYNRLPYRPHPKKSK